MEKSNTILITREEHNNRVKIAGNLVKLTRELYDMQLDLELDNEHEKIVELEKEISNLKSVKSRNNTEKSVKELKAELEDARSSKYLNYLLNVENLTVEVATRKQLDKIAELEKCLNSLKERERT